MKNLFITIAFLLAFTSPSYACICDCFEILSHRQEFRKSEAVFVGEVVKIENPDMEARERLPDNLKNELGDLVTLKMVKSWKGSKRELSIWTHATHELCSDWKFKAGEKYLVYVRKVNGVLLGAEFCSRTRLLETTDPEEISELKELDVF